MLASALALFVASSPLRGSAFIPLDSNLVLGTDTLHAVKGPCTLGSCGACVHYFRELHEAAAVSPFPGGATSPQSFEIGASAGSPAIGPNNPECAASVSTNLPLPFLLVQKAANPRAWLVDSIQYTIGTTRLPLGGPYYLGIVKPVLVRWSFAPYDSMRPLVRWNDTVHIVKQVPGPHGLPLFTTRDSVRLDSITPALPAAMRDGKSLSLGVAIDTVRAWTLAFSQEGSDAPIRQAPPSTLPPGTQIRFLDGSATERDMGIAWLLWSQGRAIDTIVVHSTIPINDKASRRTSALGPALPSRSRDILGRKPAPVDRLRQIEVLFAH